MASFLMTDFFSAIELLLEEKGEVFDGCREQVVYGLIINSLYGQDGLDGLDD